MFILTNILAWVTFFLRCYVRFYLIRKPALDDWLLGIAQVSLYPSLSQL